MKENKNSQMVSTASNPLRTGKLSRDEEVKLKKLQGTHGKLLYSDFVKVILDFQLQEHEKFLSAFTTLFKELDVDINGILSEDDFRELLSRMGITIPAEDLLNVADPHNNKQLTYSEIVQLLSS
jgi:Ca2+-binding EF-hand superfamily protein